MIDPQDPKIWEPMPDTELTTFAEPGTGEEIDLDNAECQVYIPHHEVIGVFEDLPWHWWVGVYDDDVREIQGEEATKEQAKANALMALQEVRPGLFGMEKPRPVDTQTIDMFKGDTP